ncbi:ATP cone domain-containing protein [Mucilaginibacter aquariorum]|uniref:ATP cone domain-containing protein n=1 Tax=Mucilaginibacter aquariorum TaxID=2967225 RepID=A0ABT1T8X4_9SPHI|nr:ATP cone domain-containing protein [Mucilaginibacter aquariorum]MCQ6961067.1 ATP cone domain-containing protein [Mucilaginibacter aquariorum]
MKNKEINITKASGEIALFSPEKLRHSLERSGAGEDTINEIIREVEQNLYNGITTKQIYKVAFGLLKKESRHSAAKYRLKNAIMEFGPSGFPFEKFIAAILKYQGYSVSVGEIVKGHCVNHEIDVIAEKENHHFMIECKFHNLPGKNCDVKIPLYIQARFKDVEHQWKNLPGHATKLHQGWVVTNTKFSGDAIQYGLCAGLNLLGWDFPKGNSLREQIDASGLYPVTCLTTLTHGEKQFLLDKRLVLCRDLCEQPGMLSVAGISRQRVTEIMNEASVLCKGEKP